MQSSKVASKKQKLQLNGCSALCCSCRLSVLSSSEEAESSNSCRYPTISSLPHAMVQEKLDRIIEEREEARNEEWQKARDKNTKFVVMIPTEKSSHVPREDLRDSMEQMIIAK